MSKEKIDFIRKFIPQYGGYLDFKKDWMLVNMYIQNNIERIVYILLKLEKSLPPDIASYLEMSLKFIDEVLQKIMGKSYEKISEIDTENLIPLDAKIIEVIEALHRIINNLSSGIHMSLMREYSSLIYKLSLKLSRLIDEREKLLSK